MIRYNQFVGDVYESSTGRFCLYSDAHDQIWMRDQIIESLRKYTQHTTECTDPCTCGLQQVLDSAPGNTLP